MKEPKKSRPPIAQAVYDLRRRLKSAESAKPGLSQMQFAMKMGWHLTTVAKFEGGLSPGPRALAELETVAVDNNYWDLVYVFRREVLVGFLRERLSLYGINEDELMACIEILSRPPIDKQREELILAIAPVLESYATEGHSFRVERLRAEHFLGELEDKDQ